MVPPSQEEISAAIDAVVAERNAIGKNLTAIYDEARDIYMLRDAKGNVLEFGPGLQCENETVLDAVKAKLDAVQGGVTVEAVLNDFPTEPSDLIKKMAADACEDEPVEAPKPKARKLAKPSEDSIKPFPVPDADIDAELSRIMDAEPVAKPAVRTVSSKTPQEPPRPSNSAVSRSQAVVAREQPKPSPRPAQTPTAANIYMRDIQVSDLTLEDIQKHICPAATPQEAYTFLKLCQVRGLNPFTKDAFLIKYGNSPATIVVGKEHFTKTAEMNSNFNGFEAGIIIRSVTNDLERREGTFLMDNETLLGGWAKVWRHDRTLPFVSEVSLKDFQKKTSSGRSPWDSMPGVMIRKVALVQSLREAFPNDLAGCYDRSEMDQAMEIPCEVL